MDEKYQLVFRGEVLDGQHRAVVKRRLMESLKLNDAQADKLFAGNPVVLKKAVDAKTAAGYQSLFKKAGARLRVHPIEGVQAPAADTATGKKKVTGAPDAEPSAEPAASTPVASPPVAKPETSANPTFSLLSLEETDQLVAGRPDARAEIVAPDFSVAEPGAVLVESREAVALTLPDVDFSVAEVGADLLVEPVQVEAVELGPLNFELAEVGATIGDERPAPVAPAPDISHLRIAEEA